MKKRSTIGLLAALVFVVPFTAFGVYILYQNEFEQLPIFGKENFIQGKKVHHTVPNFKLINQEAKVVSINDWNGRIVIIDFFFSSCPVVCPKMTKSLKRVQKECRKDEVLINSFSIDPERDDPARLQQYVEKFAIDTDNWNLLTGDKKEIYRLARNGFMIVATDGDGGLDDFIHSDRLVLVDRQKRIRGYYDGTNEKEVGKLIHDIKKLTHEN
jgi:protein SCO1/2